VYLSNVTYTILKMRRLTAGNALKKRRKFVAVDLFSGCGGLTKGLKKAGFRVVGAIEIEPLAASTYKKNHPEVHVWERDIRRVTAAEMCRKLGLLKGKLDLLAGCPPCQAFSTMRTLNGGRRVRDPKTKNLLNEFLRFVRVFRPKAVMVENVPGLARDHRWSIFIATLRKFGYECDAKIKNAADYGVAQRRRRLILLASRIAPVELAPAASYQVTVRQALRGLKRAGRSGDPLHDVPENRDERIIQLIKKIPKNGGSRTDLPRNQQLRCHRKCSGFKDVYGRMHWDDVAPTITSGCVNPSKGRFLHPTANRAITLREAALLQSFPRTYFFDASAGKHPTAALIGNALPPEFVRRHARQIWHVLARTK
jgi:DNA (cytosine-5)-methyltransferase 1